MRTLLAAFSCLIIAATAGGCNQSGDVASVEAIDDAAARLDEAFEARDAKAIEALMTPDHEAVTHYYETPQSVAEQIASLPELDYKQTNLTEPTVTMLSPDVAMRTVAAKLDGTFKGATLSGSVFITSIMVKQNGQWRERFYQVTDLAP
jgi:ketosteroid isomerase-like protein